MVRQALALKDKFAASHPHDWLVWEPGAWKVPASGGKLADTQATPTQGFDRPPAGDCLCFELNRGAGVPIKVGRAPENDVVVNDATVSREHLTLEKRPDGWVVVARRPAQLEGRALEIGLALPINSGARLTMGGVTLTFLSASGFSDRIQSAAGKLR